LHGKGAPCLNHSTFGSGVPPTKQSRDKESLSLAVTLSSGFFKKKGGTRTDRARKRGKTEMLTVNISVMGSWGGYSL